MSSPSLTADAVHQVIAEVFQPAHFFGNDKNSLCWEIRPREESAWEIFRGRLLDQAHTRRRRTFSAWNAYLVSDNERSAEPLLAVKLDSPADEVHVVRGLWCYAWEGYDSGDNVILSRETRKWVRELVGTIPLGQFPRAEDFRQELARRLFQAVVGTSRLPLTSVEAPLPAFSLGQLAYFFRPLVGSRTRQSSGGEQGVPRILANSATARQSSGGEQGVPRILANSATARQSSGGEQGVPRILANSATAVSPELSWRELAKLLEFLLRAVPAAEVGDLESFFLRGWRRLGRSPVEIPALVRTLFNEVSLSPYTDFVDKTFAFLRILVERGNVSVKDLVDFVSFLLRQIARHLTAYDLITFHHRGANYPDALLLDAALKAYLDLMERHAEFFCGDHKEARWRRRALRQGVLLRHCYEGHPVPDAPTSPGENARILPPPHVRVPEEQILNPDKRRRRLYADDPLAPYLGPQARRFMQQSLEDLHHPAEMRELGTAVFIDRPLGIGKLPGEPDQTPLLAHEAFSRAIALGRVNDLVRMANDLNLEFVRDRIENNLRALDVPGLILGEIWAPDRPTASLADARRVAGDFVLRRTLPASAAEFLGLFDWQCLTERFSLPFLDSPQKILIVSIPSFNSEQGVLAIFDEHYRKRLELAVNRAAVSRVRGGVEFPAAGLRLLRVWEDNSKGPELREIPQGETIPPKNPA